MGSVSVEKVLPSFIQYPPYTGQGQPALQGSLRLVPACPSQGVWLLSSWNRQSREKDGHCVHPRLPAVPKPASGKYLRKMVRINNGEPERFFSPLSSDIVKGKKKKEKNLRLPIVNFPVLPKRLSNLPQNTLAQ